MVKFLNQFAKKAKKYSKEHIFYLESLFDVFAEAVQILPPDCFVNPRSKRLNVALFESVFHSTCNDAAANGSLDIIRPTQLDIESIAGDSTWKLFSTQATTDKANVTYRLARASQLIKHLDE
jgi:hypothetical protein